MSLFFFFNDTATTEIYTLSLHDALPISGKEDLRNEGQHVHRQIDRRKKRRLRAAIRSEEHTSELQSLRHLVCRLLLEKKKTRQMDCDCFGLRDRHAHTGSGSSRSRIHRE